MSPLWGRGWEALILIAVFRDGLSWGLSAAPGIGKGGAKGGPEEEPAAGSKDPGSRPGSDTWSRTRLSPGPVNEQATPYLCPGSTADLGKEGLRVALGQQQPRACGSRGGREDSPGFTPVGKAGSDEEATGQVQPPSVVPREAVQAPSWPGYQAAATVFHQDVTKGLAEVCGPPGGHLEGRECCWSLGLPQDPSASPQAVSSPRTMPPLLMPPAGPPAPALQGLGHRHSSLIFWLDKLTSEPSGPGEAASVARSAGWSHRGSLASDILPAGQTPALLQEASMSREGILR
nr:collagen alpha-1(I) chain-like [Symphalangus syndactylus]